MKKDYLNLIKEISSVILEMRSPQEFAERIIRLSKIFFGISRVDFYILDYNTGIFKDFIKDWIYINEPEHQKNIGKIFVEFNKNFKSFALNGEIFTYEGIKSNIEEISQIKLKEKENNNIVYFPINSQERAFGVIEIEYDKISEEIEIDYKFFEILEILSIQISTAIYDHIVKDHMATALNFYDTMKNIAKIIESQYELEYIIPQIGEMIDSFISSHLIYIFSKNENEGYKLSWPRNCNNEEIINLLYTLQKEMIISEDKRIGIFPLQGENGLLGAIVAYSTIGKLTVNEIEYIEELTKQASTTIQRANVYSEVLRHATLDALTGLNNRRQFEIRLKQETSHSVRKNTDLCGLMLDIDYFKRVNDTYGHAAGDCVLKGIAEIITNTVREYDIACRYGGEEFFILLPMTNIDDTLIVAQRLRQNIEQSKIDIRSAKVKDIPYLQVTASIGISYFDKNKTPDEFYQSADKALYDSKVNGRNRVTIYKESKVITEE